jgi:hypothetical protein
LRRNPNVETRSDKDVLAFFAEGVELIEHTALHLDVGKQNVAPRRDKLQSLSDLAFDTAKFVDDTYMACRHLIDRGEERDQDQERKDQKTSRSYQIGQVKPGLPVVTDRWKVSFGCEKEQSDYRKDDHQYDIQHSFIPLLSNRAV